MAGATERLFIRGVIRLGRPEVLRDAFAIVGLDDVSKVDVPSRRVAEQIIKHLHGQKSEIPFKLELPTGLSASASYILSAEIHLNGDALGPGDHLSTVACPWSSNDIGEKYIRVQKL